MSGINSPRRCAKPPHARIVMIDVNVPHDPARTADVWQREVLGGLKGREATLTVNGQPAPPAFVIVTNHPYHYDLESTGNHFAVLADGFKIPDFGANAEFSNLIDAFKAKQKHDDVFRLVKAIAGYHIPSTFDGEVPEFAFGEAERKWTIGQRYDASATGAGLAGVLTTATVSEHDKVVHLAFHLDDGRHVLTQAAMSDAELAAHRSSAGTFMSARICGRRWICSSGCTRTTARHRGRSSLSF